jgi:hypothetical protein
MHSWLGCLQYGILCDLLIPILISDLIWFTAFLENLAL